MNKVVVVSVVAGVIAVTGIAAAVYGATAQKTIFPSVATSNKNDASADAPASACSILTEDIAKEFLGDTATKTRTATPMIYSNDIILSNCSYSAGTNGITLFLRVAKTQTGVDSNQAVFGNSKPADVEDVAGIGDDAYFDAKLGQLHILKNTNWYIVTNYKGSPIKATLDDNKALAEKLVLQ